MINDEVPASRRRNSALTTAVRRARSMHGA
jgi:hypothetical protein